MLDRILEPELMNTAEDAFEYDAMDHAAVNVQFVADLLAAIEATGVGCLLQLDTEATDDVVQSQKTPDPLASPPLTVLDLGAGTAQIPIELCRRAPHVHVVAIDAAESMLAVARANVDAAGLTNRIELIYADAKALSTNAVFPVVTSNSILHHIAEPHEVIAEAIRVTVSRGLLFHRDLARPHDEAELARLVDTYTAGGTPYQRKLFADSLRAALTVEEIRNLVAEFGFTADTVQMTSDRHWTWVATMAEGNIGM